jgi:hypothetical protein
LAFNGRSELISTCKGDTEGFVNLPLSIKGIHFSALFIEKEGFVKSLSDQKATFRPTNLPPGILEVGAISMLQAANTTTLLRTP